MNHASQQPDHVPAPLVVDVSDRPSARLPLPPLNCVQTVTVSGDSGFFLLRDPASRRNTLEIPLGADAATVRSRLADVYGDGNVSVTAHNGRVYVVEFEGALAGTHVPLMEADATWLIGEDRSATVEMIQDAPMRDHATENRVTELMQSPEMQLRLHFNARCTALVALLAAHGIITESEWETALEHATETCRQTMREDVRLSATASL